MGDDGLMVGAAYLGYRRLAGERGEQFRREFLRTVYLGPRFEEAELRAALERGGLQARPCPEIEEAIGDALARGKVVARFAGRMEYGPRALGNRSILAEARSASVNDWLNQRLKRTEFMPFAPSILEGDAARFLRGWSPDQVAARFMTVTYDVAPEARGDCPAVVHVDGTARPHVVRSDDNAGYHRILEAYKRRTGLPIVVNTSFNMHEEPIVCTPDDAVRSYRAGCADVLALENLLVQR
jgi:carbamoyltransferase